MTEPKTAEVKIDPVAEALRALLCLRLEVAPSIADDVEYKVKRAFAALSAAPSHIGEAAGMVAPAQSESIHDAARRLFAKEYPGRDYDRIDAGARVGWMEAAWDERSAPGSPAEKGEGSMMVKYRKDAIPFDCPYPSVGVRGAPYGYNIDPGAGSAMDRLQRHWLDREQVRDLRARDGEVTPLFPLYTHPASDQSDTESSYGFLFEDDDGTEWKLDDPRVTGENEYATNVRPATAKEAVEQMLSAWEVTALAEKEAGQ